MGNVFRIVVVAAFAAGAVAGWAAHATWLGIACAVLAAAAVVWAALTFRRAVLRVKETAVTLTLADAAGRMARYEKSQVLIPLRRPLVDIRDRNLFTRGRLDDFDVQPGEIGERMSLGKYYLLKIVFRPPLPPGRAVTRRISYNIYDGFVDEDVAFMIVGDYPTDVFTLRVNFPAERLPRRERAYVKVEGRPEKPGALERSPDGKTLTWRVAGMKPGVQYHVQWSW